MKETSLSIAKESENLTIKQELFCLEFVKDFNATAAAKRAGYSENMAYSIGYENTRKPQLKSRIADLIKEASMQPEEIKKRLSDIARGDLSDYIISRTVSYTPLVKRPLGELIEDLRKQIDFEDEYAMQANLKATELAAHEKCQLSRRRQIIRHKLELEGNPNAHRIVNGETILIEQADLDIVALSRDKEKGKIRSFKMTKDGPQVELYAADTALTNLARVYAMFIDRSQVDIKQKMEGMTEDQLNDLMDLVINNIQNNEPITINI